MPLTDIVLETDAPDMPMAGQEQGQPNRPDMLPRVLMVLAELRSKSLSKIATQTVKNTLDALRTN